MKKISNNLFPFVWLLITMMSSLVYAELVYGNNQNKFDMESCMNPYSDFVHTGVLTKLGDVRNSWISIQGYSGIEGSLTPLVLSCALEASAFYKDDAFTAKRKWFSSTVTISFDVSSYGGNNTIFSWDIKKSYRYKGNSKNKFMVFEIQYQSDEKGGAAVTYPVMLVLKKYAFVKP